MSPRSPRRRDERGVIFVVTAIAMTMIMAATALSFDIGREVDTNRFVQAVADAVALDAANFVDDTTASSPDPYTPIGGVDYELAQIIQYEAALSALRNNVSTSALPDETVVLGSCASGTPCSFVPIESCPLSTSLPTPDSGTTGACTLVKNANSSTDINAVQVTASSVTSFVFEAGSATSSRSATAMRGFLSGIQPHTKLPMSAFSIGSTLLDLSNPVVDSVLSSELGTSAANISVLSYSGLVGASVSLGDILAANVGVGTLYNLLNTSVTPSTLLGYYYNALLAQNTSAATAAAGQLNTALGTTGSGASKVSSTAKIQLCQLVDLSGGTTACGVTGSALTPAGYAQVDAGSFLTLIAALSDQNHAIALSISGLGLLNVTLTAVTPMATAGPGPAATSAANCPPGITPCPVTATDTQATVNLSVANINLGVASLNLGIAVTAANATGTLTGLTCEPSPSATTATISGSTNAASLTTTFAITLLGLPINYTTTTTVAGATFSHTFTGPFSSGQPPAWQSTNTNPAIAVSPPTGLVSTVLAPLTTLLNTTLDPILSPLLAALGVNLGYATLIDNYVNCDNATLVSTS